MNPWRRLFLIPLLFFYFFATSFPAEAKSFSISSVNISIWLNNDGSALIKEERKYDFYGDFTYAYQYILKQGGKEKETGRKEPYNLTNFNVCEKTIYSSQEFCYRQLSDREINEVENSRPPSTFYLKEEKDRYYLKWFYRSNNYSKIFTLSYEIENAITLQKDIAEFYWKVIGKDWEIPQDNISIKIFLPSGIPEGEIQAWAHGPLSGNISIPSSQLVSLDLPRLYRGEFVEVRLILPKNVFWSGASGTFTKEKIIAQEQSFISQTIIRQKLVVLLSQIVVFGAVVLTFVSLGAFIYKLFLFWRYGKDQKLPKINLSGRLWEPPSDIEPPQVEQLIRGRKELTEKSFTALILSLIVDGFYSLKRGEKKEGFIFKDYPYFLIPTPKSSWRKKPSLSQERIMNFLATAREKLYKNEKNLGIKLKDLKRYCRRYRFSAWHFFKNFGGAIFKKNLAEGYFEHKSHLKKAKISSRIFKLSLVVQFFGFFSFFIGSFQQLIIIFLGLIMNLVFIKLSSLMKVFGEKRTEKGREEAARWLAFKKHLKEYRQTIKEPIDSVVLWEKYLVYGTVL